MPIKLARLAVTLTVSISAMPALANDAGNVASAESKFIVDNSNGVKAGQTGDEVSATKWTFAVTPYLWGATTHARILTPQGESIRVSQSFKDSLKDLKFAVMGTFEARHRRFVIVSDLIYLHLGSGGSGEVGPIPLEAAVDLKLLSSTNMAGYRVIDKGATFVDVLGGARFTREKLDIGLSAPNGSSGRDFSKTSVGPVLASRFRTALGRRWGAALYGDIGGFGISSDLSWQLMGTVQYELSRHWRLAGGWRHYSVHDKRRGFDVQLSFDGPVAGATYRF
jgi:opacity protein-like surface antigen